MIRRLLGICAAGLLYWFPLRRWFARWGTTLDDRARVMDGDFLIVNPTHSATHAVTVNTGPDEIWPWLVQMGYQRGGLYSYDWLDRLFGFLDRPSANSILPQFQSLSVGDRILLGPREALTVRALKAGRALVLSYDAHDMQWVWQFGLYPIDRNHTRLVSRGTERMPHTVAAWILMRLMEPAAFVMTRRMLLGVKKRAEALRNEAKEHDARTRDAAA